MKNWKISKLQIQAFKAFSSVAFDFEASSLLTLDGPNGYGKTSVFDAIELLLTGKISRISDLYDVVMTGQKKNYKDNLYWNVKAGERDIEIRVEIIDTDTQKCEYFVRVGTMSDLKVAANNKPDNFGIFKLYKISELSSGQFGDALSGNYLDSYFGENFCVNYSMLNYLQQGQSRFIFSKKITDRKKELELLLKTRETKEQIELFGKVEKRIGQSCSEDELAGINALKKKIDELATVNLTPEQALEYKKISTREPVPNWDIVEPYTQLNDEDYKSHISALETLLNLILQKK